jgi:hypothetical protein
MREAALIVLGLPALVLAQGGEISTRRSNDWDPSSRRGQFDLRVRVDGRADFYIQGDRIRYAVRSGRTPQEAGPNEYTQPIPRQRCEYRLEQRDGRNAIELRDQPAPRNNYTLLIHINDPQGGDSRYHARIHWECANSPAGDWRDRRDPRDYRDRDDGRRPPDSYPRRGLGRWNPDLRGERLTSRENYPGRYNNDREGWLEFEARIDEDLVLRIHRDEIYAETLRGRPLRDERFRFSQPLPSADLRDFDLERRDGRGDVELLERPNPNNDYTAVVRVRDRDGGDDRYRFRLRWRR